MKKRLPYQIRLPEKLEEKLEKKAKERGITKEQIIREAVDRYLDSPAEARASDDT